MNTKSFALLYGLMLGILFFFLGLALAPAMQSVTGETMNNDVLNCSATPLTTMQSAVCTQIDFFTALFLGLIFGVAGIWIGGNLL